MSQSEQKVDDRPSGALPQRPLMTTRTSAARDAEIVSSEPLSTQSTAAAAAASSKPRGETGQRLQTIGEPFPSPLHARPKLRPSDGTLTPLPSIEVDTTSVLQYTNNDNDATLSHSLSELSDGEDRRSISQQQQTAQSPPQSPSRFSPGGRHHQVIHDFFYPPRQQQPSSKSSLIIKGDEDNEEEDEHTLDEGRPHSKPRSQSSGSNNNNNKHTASNVLPDDTLNLDATPLMDNLKSSSSSSTTNNKTTSILKKQRPVVDNEEQEAFQDEHDHDGDDIQPVPNLPFSLARPLSGGSGGSRESEDDMNRSSSASHTAAAAAAAHVVEEREDKAFVENFWTAYDEIIILSLFTQVGILCRLGAASFFRYFDGVFHSGSALFTNLPLNCLSCFVMGMLCSGESLMQIIHTRFSPPRLQQDLHREATTTRMMMTMQDEDCSSSEEDMMMDMEIEGSTRRRRQPRLQNRRRKRSRHGWRRSKRRTSSLIHMHGQHREPEVMQELREVQLLAWERRIRASVCLLLFPVRQEDVDVVENYFSEGYRRESQQQSQMGHQEEKAPDSVEEYHNHDRLSVDHGGSGGDRVGEIQFHEDIGDFDDLILEEEDEESPADTINVHPATLASDEDVAPPRPILPAVVETTATLNGARPAGPPLHRNPSTDSSKQGHVHARGTPHIRSPQYAQVGGNIVDYGTQENPDLDQIINTVATGVTKNISRMGRVNLAEGWDVGTSPQEKSEDLCLGLRDGLCGALSSFSSWISSMVELFRTGEFGQAIVGLMLGIQLPLIAYRFGQYVSVYIFVWRCRREKRHNERRGGYGLRLQMDEDGSCEELAEGSVESMDTGEDLSASTPHRTPYGGRTKGRRTVHDEESEIPSVRAIITALFIMCLVAQLTSLNFFYKPEHRLLALSLLFSPLGVLARWRMMKFNAWRPSFPIGTFAW